MTETASSGSRKNVVSETKLRHAPKPLERACVHDLKLWLCEPDPLMHGIVYRVLDLVGHCGGEDWPMDATH
jgi:hypothetical protein